MGQQNFGQVVVLMGGTSAEREVSLKSGQAVYQALIKQGINAVALVLGENVIEPLMANSYDRAFIVLHGRGGEDGVMQAILRQLNIPYTGSGILGSALAMNKLQSKRLWQGVGLATPAYYELNQGFDPQAVVAKCGLPLIVKPAEEGSSIGMSKVEAVEQLIPAWEFARQYDRCVLAEQWIVGKEITASIVAGQSLPLIWIETPRIFYDYTAKYHENTTKYHCPCGLNRDQEQALQQLATQAFNALGLHGWGRVDMMLDSQQQPWLIEVNTIPGMTDHSLVPMAAKAYGWDFETLVLKILQTSL